MPVASSSQHLISWVSYSWQETTLLDGAGARPGYSLRTLCRALEYAAQATPMYGLQRALYDGFAMAFLTQLNDDCAPRVESLLQRAFNPQNSKACATLPLWQVMRAVLWPQH